MKRIKISLSGEWVLEHRADDQLPCKVISDYAIKAFGDYLECKFSSITGVYLSVKSNDFDIDRFRTSLEHFLEEEYNLETASDVYDIEVYEEGETNSNASNTGSENNDSDAGDENNDSNASNESEASNENTQYTKSFKEKKSCLDKIDALVGCEEFKALAREISDISTQVIQNKTQNIFSHQCYLFSINDGNGLSTYLKLFADLIKELNIKEIRKYKPISEVKPESKNSKGDPFENIDDTSMVVDEKETSIMCIDISEWINDLNDKAFKGFLTKLSKALDRRIVIFRVPFLEREVLDRIRCSLNDLMFIKTVAFPPFTKDEIQTIAEYELKKYGFSMDESAWEGFYTRIIEEKSDGRFYGINTIKKVVNELIYSKQLTNARSGNAELIIREKDAYAICSTSFTEESGYEMLNRLVGNEKLKERINEIIAQIELARSEAKLKSPCLHMRFVGNSGTGKTTVARIIGKIFKEKGILRVGSFFEYAGRDFCGQYIGETAPKTASMCRDAYGSVLFIDEAYSLYRGRDNKDYGKEAIDTLIAEMENHRSDLIVIMAGYPDDMNTLMESNAGLASRMPYTLEFPNFDRKELYEIFVSMLAKLKYEPDLLPAVKEYFDSLTDEIIQSKEFSNARFVRNLFERTWAKSSIRRLFDKESEISITKGDFERATADKEFVLAQQNKKNRIGF